MIKLFTKIGFEIWVSLLFSRKKTHLSLEVKKKTYVIVFLVSIFENYYLFVLHTLQNVSLMLYFLQKHDSLENEFYNMLITISFFNSSLNNASTNATSLNI